MNKLFQIGDFCFSLSYPAQIVPPPNFMIFEVPEGQPEYSYTITLTEQLPTPEGEVCARRADIQVFRSGTLEHRLIGVKGIPGYYACYQERSDTAAEIFLDRTRIGELNIDPVFSSLLALERRLVEKKAMILHCAYVKHRGEAILFSAPSETGKTTQANLWEQYRGSRTINGDKSLLQRVNGRWTAQGWPVCGTSEICHNLATPIKAIVMLSQGKSDQVRIMSPAEAFSQLYSQITVNTWNRGFVQRNMDQIAALMGEVPVYHLACTISEQAVACLEAALYQEEL